ncbi:MAG: VWA domain-containing protein [Vicinamibacterales bacterium]
MMTSVRWLALGLVLTCGVATSTPVMRLQAAAQQTQSQSQAQTPPQQPQRPIFGARIDSVSVDVVVTDRQGRPVTDLTAADFTVTENNRPQEIDNFRLIEIDDSVDVDPARNREIRSLQDQERELAREDVRVIVIYLDDYHTRLGNSMAIRERLARFVRDLSPRDLVAIMTPLLPTSALTFSRNHDATARQIMAFYGRKYDYTPKHPVEEVYRYLTPEQIELLRNQIVTTGLEGLAVYLGSVREGRKSVIFVSEGLLSQLPQGVATTGLYGGGGLTPPRSIQEQMVASGAVTAGQQASDIQLLDQLKEVFYAAARSNTSFYPLDPRGLAVSEFDIRDSGDQRAGLDALRDSMDTLHVLATNTDGRAIVNSNDPQPALQQMLRDGSAYYLIGYTSTEAPRDGKFHPIKVTVNRKDVEVRHRSGYWAYSDADIERASRPIFTRPLEVERAFDAIAEPTRGRAFRSWWTTARRDDGKTDVTVIWESLVPPGPSAPAEVMITASLPEGDLVYRGRAGTVSDPTGRVAGRLTFAAPPGRVLLRLSAETADGDRLDTDERELVVPDFTGVTAVITTPEIFRARTARDVQGYRSSTTALPTTTREFTRNERLYVRFRVYLPGNTPPRPTLRLLNRNGDEISTWPVTWDPTRGAEAEVPLAGVPPGEYLLELTASGGDDTTRTLAAFRIVS